MATNTQYNPQKKSDFVKDNLQFSGQVIFFECAPSSSSYSDFVLADDYMLTGGRLLVENGNINDKLYIQIVHPTYGVVNEFISGYRISSDTVLQLNLDLDYPAKLVAGLSIRCKYVSDSAIVTRKIALNLYLHKILV